MAYGENNSLAVSESLSTGFSEAINEGISETVGTSNSDAKTKSKGSSHGRGTSFFGINFNSGRNRGIATTKSESINKSHTNTSGKAHTDTKTDTKGSTETDGSSITMTTQQQNKTIQEIMKKIDHHLDRIHQSESFGLFNVACYFSASDKRTTLTAANTFKALVAGEQSGVENSFVNLWNDDKSSWEKRHPGHVIIFGMAKIFK